MRLHATTTGAFLSLALFACGIATAGEPRHLAGRIDRHIERHLLSDDQTELVSESGFIRRVTLDLAGRIPTVSELESFRQSESLDKRAELVQRLIDSPDFAFHQRNELDTLMLRQLVHDDPWREYLLEATRENRSWDKIFREVMSPEDDCPRTFRPIRVAT